MDKYTKELRIPVSADGRKENTMTLQVYYSKGGVNLWTYKNEQRGYYISVQPEYRHGCCVEMTCFTGYKKLVEPATRFSAKKLDALTEVGFQKAREMWEQALPEFKEVVA